MKKTRYFAVNELDVDTLNKNDLEKIIMILTPS